MLQVYTITGLGSVWFVWHSLWLVASSVTTLNTATELGLMVGCIGGGEDGASLCEVAGWLGPTLC